MKAPSWLAAGWLIVFAGCVSPFTRLQSPEDSQRDKDLAVRTIGDVTEEWQAGSMQVSAVGLVTGLDGTGDAPVGEFRKKLEEQLRKQKVEHPKALLDSPDNALVLVTAMLPPGLRKGDPVDVEITLPPGSRVSSLRGGYLHDCPLSTYEMVKNLKPELNSNRLLDGHVLARARGPLMVGLGNPDEPIELRRARIWQGGNALTDRPFFLQMKNDEKSLRVAHSVAQRLEQRFITEAPGNKDKFRLEHRAMLERNQRALLQDDVTQQLNQNFEASALGRHTAKAINKELIQVHVPYAYRHNPERYLRVARMVPLRAYLEKNEQNYGVRLQEMLLDPSETVRAALRLEALGQKSIPALKNGLTHAHPLVRFAAAEALTYLGSTAGVEELARLVEPEEHVPVRYYCLLAMANLDEAACRNKLGNLLSHFDSELRCGAFLSLRLLEQGDTRPSDLRRHDSRIGGEHIGDMFWLHQVAPKTAPLVHVSLARRAEIVLFGDDVRLLTRAPVAILTGTDYTVTATRNDDRCTVGRFRASGADRGVERKQCDLRLADILKTLAELGAHYPEIVEFLRKADEQRCLNCPLRINTMPEQYSIEDLAEGGRDPNFLRPQ